MVLCAAADETNPKQGAVVALANGVGPVIGGAIAGHTADAW